MSTFQLPAYLRECLNGIAESEQFPVGTYRIECGQGSTHADGFIASIVGATIRSELPATDVNYRAELSLVCKILPDNANRRQFFSSAKLFAREAYFYNTVVPALKRFQAKHGLDDANGFFAVPHCYAAAANESANEFYIIMDDIKKKEFALNDRSSPLGLHRVRLLFEQLGRFHGLSFAMHDQDAAQFDELADGLEDVWMHMTDEIVMRKMITLSIESTLPMLKSKVHCQIMKQFASNWLELCGNCLRKGAAGRWAVIGHGDCWNNNLMFRGCDVRTNYIENF